MGMLGEYWDKIKESDYAKGVVNRVQNPGQAFLTALKDVYPTKENPFGGVGAGAIGLAGVIGKASKSGVSKEVIKQAEDLEQLGETPENIFKRLGLFKDAVDKKWRVHIPDDKAKLNFDSLEVNQYDPAIRNIPLSGTTLGQLMQHEDAYKTYPFLKDIPVKQDFGSFQGGAYDPERNIMYLGADKNPNDLLSTVLHETQHAIQTKHGLTQGGNPEQFVADAGLYKSAEKAVVDTKNKLFKELAAKFPSTNLYSSKLPDNVVNSPEYAKWKEIQDIQKKYDDLNNELYDKYKHIGGEAEARAVSAQYLNSLLKDFVGAPNKYDPKYKESTNPLDFYDVDINKTTPAVTRGNESSFFYKDPFPDTTK